MERWLNKVAVVTGASSGIGAACCKALIAKGMILVGLDIHYERMETKLKQSLPEDQKSHFHAKKCDVTKEEEILETFKWIEEKLGGVDVLLNCAGILRSTHIVKENNTADLKAILDVNVMGGALCTREAFRSMKNRDVDGHIFLMNSITGHKIPYISGFSINMYCPSKFAVTAMTEVLRQEFLLHNSKTKITSISPGLVATELIEEEDKVRYMPTLKAEDVADAIVYCIQTPPHVQIHDMILKPIGEIL